MVDRYDRGENGMYYREDGAYVECEAYLKLQQENAKLRARIEEAEKQEPDSWRIAGKNFWGTHTTDPEVAEFWMETGQAYPLYTKPRIQAPEFHSPDAGKVVEEKPKSSATATEHPWRSAPFGATHWAAQPDGNFLFYKITHDSANITRVLLWFPHSKCWDYPAIVPYTLHLFGAESDGCDLMPEQPTPIDQTDAPDHSPDSGKMVDIDNLADIVREALDRQSCPDHFMRVAYESILNAGDAIKNQQFASPEGWKLVPIKPTEEMIHEVNSGNAYGNVELTGNEHADVYLAMLSAAPEYKP